VGDEAIASSSPSVGDEALPLVGDEAIASSIKFNGVERR
jgi:hypothetical protein